MDSKESAKGSTDNMKLSTKLDITLLYNFLDTAMPSIFPLKNGLLQKKDNDGNNVGGDK